MVWPLFSMIAGSSCLWRPVVSVQWVGGVHDGVVDACVIGCDLVVLGHLGEEGLVSGRRQRSRGGGDSE